MPEYIFRIPQDCPDLDFGSLHAYLIRACDGEDLQYGNHAAIGTTADLRYYPAGPQRHEVIGFSLYGLTIALIYPGQVCFPGPEDPHLATSAWLGKIVTDNAIGAGVERIRRHKADGPGPQASRGRAGLLAIGGDRDKPVFGHAYPVIPAKIEAQRKDRAERLARWAEDREQYAAGSRRTEALKTWTGPEGTFYAVDDYNQERGSYWRAVDGTFRDGGASYDTAGFIYDTRPGRDASPEPETGPLAPPFEAHTRAGELIGPFSTLAAALAVIAHTLITATGSGDQDHDTLRELRSESA